MKYPGRSHNLTRSHSLIQTVKDVEVMNLKDIEAPTDKRAVEGSLCASVIILFNGQWNESMMIARQYNCSS